MPSSSLQVFPFCMCEVDCLSCSVNRSKCIDDCGSPFFPPLHSSGTRSEAHSYVKVPLSCVYFIASYLWYQDLPVLLAGLCILEVHEYLDDRWSRLIPAGLEDQPVRVGRPSPVPEVCEDWRPVVQFDLRGVAAHQTVNSRLTFCSTLE